MTDFRYTTFASFTGNTFKLAILVPQHAFDKKEIQKHYVDPLAKLGIYPAQVVAVNLDHFPDRKVTNQVVLPWLDNILPALKKWKTEYLLVLQPDYFKRLTRLRKVEPYYGYCCDAKLEGWEDFKVFIASNYTSLFHKPQLQNYIDFGVQGLAEHYLHGREYFGNDVLKNASYPVSKKGIKEALQDLHEYEQLTCDIETSGLQLNNARILTIAFGTSQDSGIAFSVDEPGIPKLVRQFLDSYRGELIYHGGTFDTKMMIWHWYMDRPGDIKGMLKGLHRLHNRYGDTQTIAYLTSNSAAGNKLGLKDLAYEYTGSYAMDDIENIEKQPRDKVLRYNLLDAAATWYVYNKYMPMMEASHKKIYRDLFLPSLKVITQMELIGIPLNMGKVNAAHHKLRHITKRHKQAIQANPLVKDMREKLVDEFVERDNQALKTKEREREYYADFKFNPGSTVQLRKLLYEELGLPVLNQTKSGLPSTNADSLKALLRLLKKGHVKL